MKKRTKSDKRGQLFLKTDNKRVLKFIVSIILPLIIVLNRPLAMNLNQSIILGTLVLVLIWWTTEIVNRIYASIFLLIMFAIFSDTPLGVVFNFPLSSNFYTIALSFVLSQGIVNSNAANRFSNFALNKYGNTPYKLILMSFVFGVLMIFIIPQPFSRVILLASIYEQFLKDKKISDDAKEVLFYSIFVASAVTCMFFINGNIILNYAVVQFAEISISWIEWAKYMMVPTIFASILVGLSFVLTFSKKLKNVDLSADNSEAVMGKAEFREKAAIIIIGVVIALWMTESLHTVNSAIVAFVGTLAMIGFGIIGIKDIKSLNVDLMIFLTAAFAIGGVMNQSGVADLVYSSITGIFPTTYSNMYLVILILTAVGVHMLLGNAIATLSVLVPGLIGLTQGIIDVIPLTLLLYIVINMHYILPFHHIVIMIGAGTYYSNKIVIKHGIVLTVVMFLAIFLFYIPWWKFINLI